MSMWSPRKIAVLIGPSSGKGSALESEEALASWLKGRDVAVCAGRFAGTGAQASWARLRPTGDADRAKGYVEELRASVATFAAWRADLLVCVGGDGLASYAADAMLASGIRMAMLGIAAGTINVGPIISVGIEALKHESLDACSTEPVGAVEVLVDDQHLAYGFNDIVIGDTFLGTVGGRVASFSAQALLDRGEKVEARASADIASRDFGLWKNGKKLDSNLRQPAQIIVSPLKSREFFARAVAGPLCNAAYMQGPAALALFDSVIVAAGPPGHGIEDFSASEQILFSPEDVIALRGLTGAGHVIVDGNPYARRGETVGFKSLPDLVDVVKTDRSRLGGSREWRLPE
ncbi:MAG: diacylglycerol kinase family protein [Rectinemataceae bacterium]|nr:diacylglycerol kinase family protein [Rectinemataceae bacterium]